MTHRTIQEKAMLVELHIGQWQPVKKDKKATQAAIAAFGAKDNSGDFRKNLIDKAGTALERIGKIAGEARSYHYEHTIPWTHRGEAVLPAVMFAEYSAEMRRLRSLFETEVAAFLPTYPALKQQARHDLNGMWNDSDYPSEEKLLARFQLEVSVSPIPEGAHFLADVGMEEQAKVRSEIEHNVSSALDRGHADLYKRLADAVGNIAEKLSDPKGIFRDSLLGNLAELIELLPRLDLKGDPELEKIRKQAEVCLLRHDPQTLRKDKAARSEVAKDAAAILARAEEMLG